MKEIEDLADCILNMHKQHCKCELTAINSAIVSCNFAIINVTDSATILTLTEVKKLLISRI